MARASEDRLLALLPEMVREYRHALVANDLRSEARCRSKVCSVIEWLLEIHVNGCRGCESISMIDGVLPATLDVSDSTTVLLVGVAVWAGQGGWFLDPVAAEIQLPEDGNSIPRYSLSFGDADFGLGKYLYKPYSKDRYRSPPSEWSFIFGNSDRAAGLHSRTTNGDGHQKKRYS